MNLFRQARCLPSKQNECFRFKGYFIIVLVALSGYQTDFSVSILMKKIIEGLMYFFFQKRPIVQAGPFNRLVIQIKAARLYYMKLVPCNSASSSNISRVLWNVRLIQNNIH